MKQSNLVTWTGISVDNITEELSVPFDAGGYKPIPSGANLTDINTGYMLERTLKVFGPKGLGWGLEYDASDLEYQGDGKRVLAIMKKAIFWYKLYDSMSGTEMMKCEIPCSGAHQNEYAYAAEGARTSALGGALKGLGFQLPLYKGMWDTPAARTEARNSQQRQQSSAKLDASPELKEYMRDCVQYVCANLEINVDDAKPYVMDVLKEAKMTPAQALAKRAEFDVILKETVAKDKAAQ